jgi:L,D-transpeptidase ErfK/SrfK
MNSNDFSHRSFAAAAGCAALLACLPAITFATQYELLGEGAVMFGAKEIVTAKYEDTLPDLARLHSLGYEEILRANPGVDPWLPGAGTQLVLPGQRILPPGPREGIVINLPEHRLYFFPKPKKGEPQQVLTFPVSVGKMDWRTPLGQTKITQKRANPIWYPPESVRKEHAARGEPLPKAVPAGPDNPLGAHAMRLGIPGGSYLIHGTNNPLAVGMAVTHGCIRMYPEDIEKLFPLVPVGTKVWLINEPLKVARVDGQLWVEVHPPIDAEGQTVAPDLPLFEQMLDKALGEAVAAVHWEYAQNLLGKAQGIPTVVGLELETEAPPDGAPSETPAQGVSGESLAAPVEPNAAEPQPAEPNAAEPKAAEPPTSSPPSASISNRY